MRVDHNIQRRAIVALAGVPMSYLRWMLGRDRRSRPHHARVGAFFVLAQALLSSIVGEGVRTAASGLAR